ncbi:hypothetical protein HPP92_023425 [Vanilla planifolia]|uniref:DUF4408 domain-containing protein n=1 Tax=Vanilla planifolia TaxID=51239 RepID=A0A835PW33_VANPL|nr:hypothetical protein HPP92_023425 [Vanilla planifolia]
MDAVKLEKQMAMRRFRRLRQIGRLLRCIEAAAAVLLLSYSSAYIPTAARNSGEFLRRAAAFFVSPRFVFLLGNAIVLVLFKSGHFSDSTVADSGTCSSAGSPETRPEASYPPPLQLERMDDVMHEDKRISMDTRTCRRSRSEKFEKGRKKLKFRRAESEIGRKGDKTRRRAAHCGGNCEWQHGGNVTEEDFDDEQFRRTIEEFIAKQQQQFRRNESFAAVAGSVG